MLQNGESIAEEHRFCCVKPGVLNQESKKYKKWSGKSQWVETWG